MPRTAKKKIDKKVKKTKSRRAVPLAVREARLQSRGPSRTTETNLPAAKPIARPLVSAPSPSPERDGADMYDMMFRWSPLPVILRQQALASSIFLSLAQIWSPR